MADLAPSTEAPKPAAAKAPPAPVADPDDAPLPPLDPEAEVGEQIKRAQENVARAERKAKKQTKAKGKPKAAPKATEAPPPEVPDTEPAPPPEEAEPETPELEQPSAATLVKARLLAEKGDMDAAFKLAFGKSPDAFRVSSARWMEWRKATDNARREMTQREQRLAAGVEQLRREFAPLAEARKLFQAEDYEGAFQKAFGLDLNSFQKKAISKFHGKSPEAEAVRRELEELRAALRKRDEEAEQSKRQQQEQAQHAANREAIEKHLGGSDDPQLAALATKPRFIRQVYQEFLQRTEAGEPASMLLVAACAEEIRDGLLGEFGDVFVPRDLSASGRPHPGGTIPESPRQAGKKPVRPGAANAAPSTLSQRGASEASSPGGPELSDEELFRKYTDRMKNAS